MILNIGFILEVNQNKEAVVHKENMDMILIHASGNMVDMEIILQFLKEKYGLLAIQQVYYGKAQDRAMVPKYN